MRGRVYLAAHILPPRTGVARGSPCVQSRRPEVLKIATSIGGGARAAPPWTRAERSSGGAGYLFRHGKQAQSELRKTFIFLLAAALNCGLVPSRQCLQESPVDPWVEFESSSVHLMILSATDLIDGDRSEEQIEKHISGQPADVFFHFDHVQQRHDPGCLAFSL